MHIPDAGVLSDDGICVLQGTFIASIDQVKDSLSSPTFETTLGLQLLYTTAGHMHNTDVAKRQIRLSQSQVHNRIIRV